MAHGDGDGDGAGHGGPLSLSSGLPGALLGGTPRFLISMLSPSAFSLAYASA